jgi:hypothetical protein
MADYYPLISRAVAGLAKSTVENRRVLYERARSALVSQLRGVEPALNDSDITRERLALEEAVRKVEAEALKEMPPEAPAGGDAQPSLLDHGLLRFHSPGAEGQAEAAARTNRSSREAAESAAADRSARTAETDRGSHLFEPPASELPPVAAKPAPPPPPPPPPPPARPLAQFDGDDIYSRPVHSRGRVLKLILLLLVLAGLAGVGYWQRGAIAEMVAGLRNPSAPKPSEPAPAGRPKIADRIGSSNETANPANAPAAAVAQKVVLYEEDPNDPKGKRYVGSAIWRTETVSPGSGLPPELAVRADVEIPERHMRMTWSLRRNTDKALPASHTIEIIFTLPADFDQGGIGNVPGVLMKAEEQARGTPLAGLAVKVTNGYFLIGLSAVDVDKQRNVKLMKDEDWLDIPVVYTTGKRAILAIEKGTPGGRAFEEAFRAWGE